MKTPMIGAAYLARSPNLAMQSCINLYPEIVESKSGKEVGALFGCPGLTLVATIGAGPIRGLLPFNGLLYAVSGATAYSLTTAFASTSLGGVGNDGSPVSMVNNPTQLAIFSAGAGYSVVAGTLANIALPFNGAGIAAYQDGLAVVSQPGTFNLWQSNINDLTTWDPLNFDTADGSADNIVGLIDMHRQIIVLKTGKVEIWINAGNSGFVFQRLEGVYPDVGCVAPYSIARSGEEIAWLGRNSQGQGICYAMLGYEPVRVSTHAMETRWATYPTIADAIAFTYQQEGHAFYVLTFPSGNETWVLDFTASKSFGFPVWHQRAYFSNGKFSRYLPTCSAAFNGQIIVGDGFSGNLYAMDLKNYTDNGAPRKWLRSWRAHAQTSVQTVPYRCLEIDLETGIGVADGFSPNLSLRYTDDAHTWSNERIQAAGPAGAVSQRVRFNRLGMERRGLNNDRVLELSSSDAFKVALIGADIS